MALEKLALGVAADRAGLKSVVPATMKGASGTDHRFGFLATDGSTSFAFDIYDEVGEVEVLRSFLKKFDTGAVSQIVCLRGAPSSGAERLAEEYGIRILSPEAVGSCFGKVLVQATAR
jgi:hypothetical protein